MEAVAVSPASNPATGRRERQNGTAPEARHLPARCLHKYAPIEPQGQSQRLCLPRVARAGFQPQELATCHPPRGGNVLAKSHTPPQRIIGGGGGDENTHAAPRMGQALRGKFGQSVANRVAVDTETRRKVGLCRQPGARDVVASGDIRHKRGRDRGPKRTAGQGSLPSSKFHSVVSCWKGRMSVETCLVV